MIPNVQSAARDLLNDKDSKEHQAKLSKALDALVRNTQSSAGREYEPVSVIGDILAQGERLEKLMSEEIKSTSEGNAQKTNELLKEIIPSFYSQAERGNQLADELSHLRLREESATITHSDALTLADISQAVHKLDPDWGVEETLKRLVDDIQNSNSSQLIQDSNYFESSSKSQVEDAKQIGDQLKDRARRKDLIEQAEKLEKITPKIVSLSSELPNHTTDHDLEGKLLKKIAKARQINQNIEALKGPQTVAETLKSMRNNVFLNEEKKCHDNSVVLQHKAHKKVHEAETIQLQTIDPERKKNINNKIQKMQKAIPQVVALAAQFGSKPADESVQKELISKIQEALLIDSELDQAISPENKLQESLQTLAQHIKSGNKQGAIQDAALIKNAGQSLQEKVRHSAKVTTDPEKQRNLSEFADRVSEVINQIALLTEDFEKNPNDENIRNALNHKLEEATRINKKIDQSQTCRTILLDLVDDITDTKVTDAQEDEKALSRASGRRIILSQTLAKRQDDSKKKSQIMKEIDKLETATKHIGSGIAKFVKDPTDKGEIAQLRKSIDQAFDSDFLLETYSRGCDPVQESLLQLQKDVTSCQPREAPLDSLLFANSATKKCTKARTKANASRDIEEQRCLDENSEKLETLIPEIQQLAQAFHKAPSDTETRRQLNQKIQEALQANNNLDRILKKNKTLVDSLLDLQADIDNLPKAAPHDAQAFKEASERAQERGISHSFFFASYFCVVTLIESIF